MEMSKSLFITGTGTDVGKTYVAGLFLKKLREAGLQAAYYKAAMSGNEVGADNRPIPEDALYVKHISGVEQSLAGGEPGTDGDCKARICVAG